MDKKTIEYSRTVMSQVMMPNHANPNGNVHGGEIMKMMDNTAYVVARKHASHNVVTARVDELQFHLPVYVGNLVTCKAKLIFVGKSSMEIFVKIEVEDFDTDEPPQTALTAFFTMVALDNDQNPVAVPDLKLETKTEKEAFDRGQKRYKSYKNLKT
jgi:acyl-CoA hydrolase